MPTGEDMNIDDWRVRYEELNVETTRLRKWAADAEVLHVAE